MIRTYLTDKVDYNYLRQKYLEKIARFILFDKKDILPNKSNAYSDEGKSKETAKLLKNKYQNLYKFLFYDLDSVNKDNLRMLLVGPDSLPDSFGGSNGEFKTMHDCLKKIISVCKFTDEESEKEAYDICKKIFDYDSFVRDKQEAYWLLRNLGVRVCPYCNRIYTITLPTKEELEKGESFYTTRATFDHFYSKSKYPYLALSLFNLVTSCHICNNNKRDNEKKIVYPYDEGFDKNAVFRVIPDLENTEEGDNSLNVLTGESDNFYIKFMSKNRLFLSKKVPLEERLSNIKDKEYRERVIGSITMFHLEEQYKEYKAEIKDILRNRYYFNEEYVRSVICPMLRDKMKEKNVDDNQIWNMAMDMLFFNRINQQEWGERPLSKLISDILDQISIY